MRHEGETFGILPNNKTGVSTQLRASGKQNGQNICLVGGTYQNPDIIMTITLIIIIIVIVTVKVIVVITIIAMRDLRDPCASQAPRACAEFGQALDASPEIIIII